MQTCELQHQVSRAETEDSVKDVGSKGDSTPPTDTMNILSGINDSASFQQLYSLVTSKGMENNAVLTENCQFSEEVMLPMGDTETKLVAAATQLPEDRDIVIPEDHMLKDGAVTENCTSSYAVVTQPTMSNSQNSLDDGSKSQISQSLASDMPSKYVLTKASSSINITNMAFLSSNSSSSISDLENDALENVSHYQNEQTDDDVDGIDKKRKGDISCRKMSFSRCQNYFDMACSSVGCSSIGRLYVKYTILILLCMWDHFCDMIIGVMQLYHGDGCFILAFSFLPAIAFLFLDLLRWICRKIEQNKDTLPDWIGEWGISEQTTEDEHGPIQRVILTITRLDILWLYRALIKAIKKKIKAKSCYRKAKKNKIKAKSYYQKAESKENAEVLPKLQKKVEQTRAEAEACEDKLLDNTIINHILETLPQLLNKIYTYGTKNSVSRWQIASVIIPLVFLIYSFTNILFTRRKRIYKLEKKAKNSTSKFLHFTLKMDGFIGGTVFMFTVVPIMALCCGMFGTLFLIILYALFLVEFRERFWCLPQSAQDRNRKPIVCLCFKLILKAMVLVLTCFWFVNVLKYSDPVPEPMLSAVPSFVWPNTSAWLTNLASFNSFHEKQGCQERCIHKEKVKGGKSRVQTSEDTVVTAVMYIREEDVCMSDIAVYVFCTMFYMNLIGIVWEVIVFIALYLFDCITCRRRAPKKEDEESEMMLKTSNTTAHRRKDPTPMEMMEEELV